MTVVDRFHWEPGVIMAMTLRELIEWADMAVDLNEQDRKAWGSNGE
jgi:hypothetical protein